MLLCPTDTPRIRAAKRVYDKALELGMVVDAGRYAGLLQDEDLSVAEISAGLNACYTGPAELLDVIQRAIKPW